MRKRNPTQSMSVVEEMHGRHIGDARHHQSGHPGQGLGFVEGGGKGRRGLGQEGELLGGVDLGLPETSTFQCLRGLLGHGHEEQPLAWIELLSLGLADGEDTEHCIFGSKREHREHGGTPRVGQFGKARIPLFGR